MKQCWELCGLTGFGLGDDSLEIQRERNVMIFF